MNNDLTHDVAIIGGGSAGLSAAVALARSLRSVVVVDAGEPRNAPAAGAHNVLGREGVSPLELLAAGRREAEQYGAQIRHDHAVAAHRRDDGFEVDLAAEGTVRARRLLLATGLTDELPDVPGVREHWGASVLHCAYCHGWEVRGQRIGVLGTSHPGRGGRAAQPDGRRRSDGLLERQRGRQQPPAPAIRVGRPRRPQGLVGRLRDEDGELRSVVLEDGHEFGVDAVTVAPRWIARAELYEQLGGTLTEHPHGAFIETGPMGRTEIPGVWAAGNASDLSAMVAAATAAGVAAGAAINADLVTEDARAAARARTSAAPA